MATEISIYDTVKKLLLSKNLKQQQTPAKEKSKMVGVLAQMTEAEEVLAQKYAGTFYKG